MKPNADLTEDQIYGSARASDDVYRKDQYSRFDTTRIISQFWLTGDLIACTRVDQETDTAYVAVRGTRDLGNWLFTNLQGNYTRLQVIDDSLSGDGREFQGGVLRTPVQGCIHQGFMRAFARLWYGTEPVLSQIEPSRQMALLQVLKYLLVFFGPLTAWYVLGRLGIELMTLKLATLSCLAIAMLVICVEKGVVEDLFRNNEPPLGKPLCIVVKDLNRHKYVVFTGHSLGGAIASVLFAVYRAWCLSSGSRNDNAHLVTFGSARVGDTDLVRNFERQHGVRMLHLEHPGDPVPQVPPSGLRELLRMRYPIRGLGGMIIAIAFIPWSIYKYMYKIPSPCRWSSQFVDTMNQRENRRLCLNFHSMKKVYLMYTKSFSRSAAERVDA